MEKNRENCYEIAKQIYQLDKEVYECVGCLLYTSMIYADVAQLAEQLICNQQVIGSSPIIGFHDSSN